MGLVLSNSDFSIKGEKKEIYFKFAWKERLWESRISLHNIAAKAMWILHLLGYK